MSDKDDYEAAKEVLFNFMQEMFEWEVLLNRNQDESGGKYFDLNKEKIRKSIVDIYDRYLTKKERKTGRIAALNFGIPYAYNLAAETIIGHKEVVSGRKKNILIETVYKTHMECKRRYTMVKTHEGWKLDRREDFSVYKDKWISYSL